jgi:hypothetical protein
MGICALCRQEKELQDSPVLPELQDPSRAPREPGAEGSGDPQIGGRWPGKELREKLLCADCERFLTENFEAPHRSVWRSLAQEEPGPELSVQTIELPDGGRAAHVSGVDYASFKLLLLSLLWRASVSKREEFAAVSLGPHEEILRQMLLSREPGSQADYPCLVFLVPESKSGAWIPPFRDRMEGHNAYHLVLSGVRLDILVSRHAANHPFRRFALKEDGSFLAIFLNRRDAETHGDPAEAPEAVDPSPSPDEDGERP